MESEQWFDDLQRQQHQLFNAPFVVESAVLTNRVGDSLFAIAAAVAVAVVRIKNLGELPVGLAQPPEGGRMENGDSR